MRNQSAQYRLWLSVSVEEYVASLFSLSLAFNVGNSLGQKVGHVEKKRKQCSFLIFSPLVPNCGVCKEAKRLWSECLRPSQNSMWKPNHQCDGVGGGVIGR